MAIEGQLLLPLLPQAATPRRGPRNQGIGQRGLAGKSCELDICAAGAQAGGRWWEGRVMMQTRIRENGKLQYPDQQCEMSS